MLYIIDGYNFMFRILHAGDDLQSQRQQIIRDINDKIQLVHLEVTIVFDAPYQCGEGSRTHLNHLEICFTDEGESADDFIIQKLKHASHPKQITVVTSDNKLAWRARRYLAKTEKVEVFLAWLNKKYHSKARQQKQRTPTAPSRRLKEQPCQDGPPPSPGATPEESFDYYLYQFEKKFQEMESD